MPRTMGCFSISKRKFSMQFFSSLWIDLMIYVLTFLNLLQKYETGNHVQILSQGRILLHLQWLHLKQKLSYWRFWLLSNETSRFHSSIPEFPGVKTASVVLALSFISLVLSEVMRISNCDSLLSWFVPLCFSMETPSDGEPTPLRKSSKGFIFKQLMRQTNMFFPLRC